MSEKITVKYIPQSLTVDGTTRYFARITDRTTYGIDQIVNYALDNGHVRGQFEDMKGTFNGFIAAMKRVLELGAAVNCGWFRIDTSIKGQLDENMQVTDDNKLKTKFLALADLKLDKDNFSFQNVEDPESKAKITDIMSVGKLPNVVVPTADIAAYGKNLFFDATLGDKVEMYYVGRASVKSITPSSSDYAHIVLPAQSELADLDNGTAVTFTFTLHGGVEGSQAQVITKTCYKAES